MDCIVFFAILRGLYVGYRSGLFAEILRIIAYLITLGVAFHFRQAVADFLTLNTFLNEEAASGIGFGSLLVVTFIATKLISVLLHKLLKIGEGGALQRTLGALLGALRWIILLSLLFMLIEHSWFSPLKKDIRERSFSGAIVADAMPTLFDYLSGVSPQLGLPRNDRA